METKDNHIDDLMRSTLKEESPGDDATLWNRIDKTLKYKRFLRFSFSCFNIFYSVALIVIITSAYFIWSGGQENGTNVNNDIKSNISKPSQTNNSGKSTNNARSVVPEQNQGTTTLKKGEPPVTSSNSTKDIKTVTESSANTEPSTTQKTKKVKIVKKQVLITDTIRKKDTVYIKK